MSLLQTAPGHPPIPSLQTRGTHPTSNGEPLWDSHRGLVLVCMELLPLAPHGEMG